VIYRLFVQIAPAQGGRVVVHWSVAKYPGNTLPRSSSVRVGNQITKWSYYKTKKEALEAGQVAVNKYSVGPRQHPLLTRGQGFFFEGV
jgi:hypothetical protein